MKRLIFETEDKTYRILEIQDENVSIDDLAGDSFCPKTNPEIDRAQLKRQEADFIDLVNREGVFGYVLEKWNFGVGIGYEHINSCWGFVGQYSESDEKFKHYIVDELKDLIK